MLDSGSKNRQVIEKIGGASRDRTDDLIVANDALSQLSYSPIRRLDRKLLPYFISVAESAPPRTGTKPDATHRRYPRNSAVRRAHQNRLDEVLSFASN